MATRETGANAGISRRDLLAGTAGLAAFTAMPWVARAQEGPVRIGSKDFTEQLILGEMYALLLENAGIATEKRLNLGGTQVAQEADSQAVYILAEAVLYRVEVEERLRRVLTRAVARVYDGRGAVHRQPEGV